jgi:hypothetical protein
MKNKEKTTSFAGKQVILKFRVNENLNRGTFSCYLRSSADSILLFWKPPMSNPWQLRLARRAIDSGGVVAYPTEGVWGLGCDPMNAAAVERVLAIKHRDAGRGFIVIAS